MPDAGNPAGTRHTLALKELTLNGKRWLRAWLVDVTLYKRHSELSRARQAVYTLAFEDSCPPVTTTNHLWAKHCPLHLLFMKFKSLGGIERVS